MIFRILVGLCAVYVLVAAGMFLMQRNFIYAPDKTAFGAPPEGMELFEITAADGLMLGGWFAPAKEDKPTIVLFHGNAGNISGRAYKATFLISEGYGVILPEYRGYGGNLGRPSEKAFYSDARQILAWLEARGLQESKIILYGESLGSGVAVQMAQERPNVAGLILETPFTSLVDMGRRSYPWLPVSLLLRDKFDNASKISSIRIPVLILHGQRDQVVPWDQGLEIWRLAAEDISTFSTFTQGDHSDLWHLEGYNARQAILDWLQSL